MREYWHMGDDHKPNRKVDEFLDDLFELYEKHGMSLSHEDDHGSFIIEEDCDVNRKWMQNLIVDIKETSK